MGKQGKRRRRRRERNRGIAPQALFNFALMMGAYFPCVVTIISLSYAHTSTVIFPLPLILALPFCFSCYISSPFSLFIVPHRHFQHHSIVRCLHQQLFQHLECVCGHTFMRMCNLPFSTAMFIYQLLPLPTEKSTAPCKLANTAIIYTFFSLFFLKFHTLFTHLCSPVCMHRDNELQQLNLALQLCFFYGSSSPGHP